LTGWGVSFAEDPKKLSDAAAFGQAGVGFIQTMVGLMEHQFAPYGQPEVGIDGAIELRDPATRAMTGRVVFVQSKAHRGPFDDETEAVFAFRVERRDLDYWMQVSGPVVLIVSRPADHEGYWVDVKEYFKDPERRERRVIAFDKATCKFTAASSDGLFDVFRTHEARRAQAAQALVKGPLAALGLADQLADALDADAQRDFVRAGAAWSHLVQQSEGRLPPQFVWPMLERQARALSELTNRRAAAAIYRRLAHERVELDDPSAEFDLHREFWGGGERDFQFALLSVRAGASEQGREALVTLRRLHAEAPTTSDRRDAAAALVDALVLHGLWVEAVTVADTVALKRLDSAQKRMLLMDRCDAAGELGLDVCESWDRVVRSARRAGPWHLGQALQRRGVFFVRRGDLGAAQACFEQAGSVWAAVPGAEEQAAEAMASIEVAQDLVGQRAEALPFGARAAGALARGDAPVPVVRADGLMLSGLAYLADERLPDALKHLVLGLMVERRAGDLFGLQRALLFAGRAHAAVNEPTEALRWFIRAGLNDRAESAARATDFQRAGSVLRLRDAPAFERAASFAALAVWAPALSQRDVGQIAQVTVDAAQPLPDIRFPQPSFHARRVLAVVADRLALRYAKRAARILREEVELHGYCEREAAIALTVLTHRGAIDALPFLCELMLQGRDLSVTVSGHIRDGSPELQRRVVDAAVGGSAVALGEAARADLPDRYPELRALCDARIDAALQPSDVDPEREIGVSFVELGELGRHCAVTRRRRLTELLLSTAIELPYDGVSKTSALVALALLAPALEKSSAARGLRALLPLAAGQGLTQARSHLQSHANPERSRTILGRGVPDARLRSAALQACGLLAARGSPRSRALARVIDRTLEPSAPEELLVMALQMLIAVPELPVRADPLALLNDQRDKVRRAAQAVRVARETEI
jgi:hypothetical protein